MKFSKNKKIQKLIELSKEATMLKGIGEVLDWDQNVNMPKNAAEGRSYQLALISSITHQKVASDQFGEVVKSLDKEIKENPAKFTLYDRVLVRESLRAYEKATKLLKDFVERESEAKSKGFEAWKEAKEKSDFSIFEPFLKKLVDLAIEEAGLLGYEDSPYDALLDKFEQGLTEKQVEKILSPLRDFTVSFLQKVLNSNITIDGEILKRKFNTQKQLEFGKELAEDSGYSFDSGRLDIAPHPFTTEFGTSSDVRITTRVDEGNLPDSILSTIHESGHGMYEQNIDKALDMTILSEETSYAMHEAMARMWENPIGRSKYFWNYQYPRLVRAFPKVISLGEKEKFISAINIVEPGFIRVDADEITYNLHIILRFEIERDLIKGKVRVKDLPEIWNSKMQEYLGITPPNDALGVLQDVHWSYGLFGYFPSYSIGNIYAAQLMNKMNKDIIGINKQLQEGDYTKIRTWLEKNVQQYGKVLTAGEICEKATGEKLNSKYLIEYLEDKFGRIYKI
ncbi:carboxypeptidase M32 [Patescibacteria group bacterium]